MTMIWQCLHAVHCSLTMFLGWIGDSDANSQRAGLQKNSNRCTLITVAKTTNNQLTRPNASPSNTSTFQCPIIVLTYALAFFTNLQKYLFWVNWCNITQTFLFCPSIGIYKCAQYHVKLFGFLDAVSVIHSCNNLSHILSKSGEWEMIYVCQYQHTCTTNEAGQGDRCPCELM